MSNICNKCEKDITSEESEDFQGWCEECHDEMCDE